MQQMTLALADEQSADQRPALAEVIDLGAYRFTRAARAMGFDATFEIAD